MYCFAAAATAAAAAAAATNAAAAATSAAAAVVLYWLLLHTLARQLKATQVIAAIVSDTAAVASYQYCHTQLQQRQIAKCFVLLLLLLMWYFTDCCSY
jgi:hypothetical protein